MCHCYQIYTATAYPSLTTCNYHLDCVCSVFGQSIITLLTLVFHYYYLVRSMYKRLCKRLYSVVFLCVCVCLCVCVTEKRPFTHLPIKIYLRKKDAYILLTHLLYNNADRDVCQMYKKAPIPNFLHMIVSPGFLGALSKQYSKNLAISTILNTNFFQLYLLFTFAAFDNLLSAKSDTFSDMCYTQSDLPALVHT